MDDEINNQPRLRTGHKNPSNMKDYRKLTNEELFNELDNLLTDLEQEEAMDGSGELGERIYKMFEPSFNAVYAEMHKRGLYEND